MCDAVAMPSNIRMGCDTLAGDLCGQRQQRPDITAPLPNRRRLRNGEIDDLADGGWSFRQSR